MLALLALPLGAQGPAPPERFASVAVHGLAGGANWGIGAGLLGPQGAFVGFDLERQRGRDAAYEGELRGQARGLVRSALLAAALALPDPAPQPFQAPPFPGVDESLRIPANDYRRAVEAATEAYREELDADALAYRAGLVELALERASAQLAPAARREAASVLLGPAGFRLGARGRWSLTPLAAVRHESTTVCWSGLESHCETASRTRAASWQLGGGALLRRAAGRHGVVFGARAFPNGAWAASFGVTLPVPR